MNAPEAPQHDTTPFEPRHPNWLAAALCSVWIVILSVPMLAGRFLGTWASDQYKAGYGFRAWAAEQWRTTGRVPLWNPEIFGGMPFVAGMHGDIFYPTAWARLLLPTHVAMNLGFAVHYVLCGLFAYLFLRRIKVSWTGSVLGGIAYQLTGVIASLVNPGHDGKLFVSALFPLALLALIMALREKKWEGQALLALTVGLAFLAPHPQLLYYMLVASGVFALYLTFGEPTTEPIQPRLIRLGVSLAAILVAFGIGTIQMLPFYYYIPYSPRAETVGGWERATSYAIPWSHIPEFVFARFVGQTTIDGATYWGTNGLKLHSEYLGLPVVALAVLGIAGTERKRLRWWLGGIAALFMLVALGTSTPFYRVWYEVMPFMKQVRAPGMAFYIPAFVVAVFAGIGVDRLLRGEGKTHVQVWLGLGGVAGVFALFGAFGGMAQSLAVPARAQAAAAAADSVRWGAFGSALALAAVGVIGMGVLRREIKLGVAGLLLIGVVGTDLWWNARTFWNYSDAPDTLFAGDDITEYIQSTDLPYRVISFGMYPPTNAEGSVLMAYGIPELLGHHANELDAFDHLVGRYDPDGPFGNRMHTNILDLYAVRFLIVPSGQGIDSLPGFDKTLTDVMTAGGVPGDLFEAQEPLTYARIVPVALQLPLPQVVSTVLDERFPLDRVVVIDSTAGFTPPDLTVIPDSLPASVSVTEWNPGHMTLEISPPAPQDAYVVVGENWYTDWRATVDGTPTPTFRGNGAVIALAVPAGASEIELRFESDAYKTGKGIMLVSVLIIAAGFVGPAVARRRGSA